MGRTYALRCLCAQWSKLAQAQWNPGATGDEERPADLSERVTALLTRCCYRPGEPDRDRRTCTPSAVGRTQGKNIDRPLAVALHYPQPAPNAFTNTA